MKLMNFVDYIGEGEVLDILSTPVNGHIRPEINSTDMSVSVLAFQFEKEKRFRLLWLLPQRLIKTAAGDHQGRKGERGNLIIR